MAIKPLSSDMTAKLFMGWPHQLDTWRAVRRFGGDVMNAYWTQRSPLYLKGSRRELLRPSWMFLRYGRAVEAIQSSLNPLAELSTELAFRMLDGVIPQLNAKAAPADTMSTFYVEKLLESLDGRADVSDEQIARREFQLLPLLEHSRRQLRIYRLMAADPGFYHSILRNVFLGKSEEKREVDEETQAIAHLSYSLLSHFSLLPGQSGTDIDAGALSRWIDEVRHLGANTDREQITDNYIGHVLAHAPADPDGAWPHQAGRNEIERLASNDVERAIQVERFNMRGVHSIDIYQGGNEERDFSKLPMRPLRSRALGRAPPRCYRRSEKCGRRMRHGPMSTRHNDAYGADLVSRVRAGERSPATAGVIETTDIGAEAPVAGKPVRLTDCPNAPKGRVLSRNRRNLGECRLKMHVSGNAPC